MNIIICTVLVSTVCFGRAQDDQLTESSPPISDKNNITAKFNDNDNVETYKKLFVTRRMEHLIAVKKIRDLDSYERQYKMVSMVVNQIVQTIVDAKMKIINGTDTKSLTKSVASLFSDVETRDALSSVLENTALFGDIVLQLPEITQRILKKEKSWNETMKWSLIFVNENRFLLDQPTIAMFEMALQELNLTTRSENYSNPYWNNEKKVVLNHVSEKEKKKTKRNKGPQVVKIDL